MSFLGSLFSPITNLLGGGKSTQSQNTTVNTSTKQIFSPNNNIKNVVNNNIDIDKLAKTLEANLIAEQNTQKAISKYGLAQALSIAQKHDILLQDISTASLSQKEKIAKAQLSLQYAIAKKNLSQEEQDKLMKEDNLKLSVLTLDEQKQQNKRMTWIALAGLTMTAGGFIVSNIKKRGGKK